MKISSKKIVLAAFMAVLLSSCGSDKSISVLDATPAKETFDSTAILTLAPYVNTVSGWGPYMVAFVDENSGESYTNIKGFKFTWGVRSTIKVGITKHDDPPSDSSDTTYTLIETLSSEPAADNEIYSIAVFGDNNSFDPSIELQGNIGTLFKNWQYQTNFECSTQEICDSLEMAIAYCHFFKVKFLQSFDAKLEIREPPFLLTVNSPVECLKD